MHSKLSVPMPSPRLLPVWPAGSAGQRAHRHARPVPSVQIQPPLRGAPCQTPRGYYPPCRPLNEEPRASEPSGGSEPTRLDAMPGDPAHLHRLAEQQPVPVDPPGRGARRRLHGAHPRNSSQNYRSGLPPGPLRRIPPRWFAVPRKPTRRTCSGSGKVRAEAAGAQWAASAASSRPRRSGILRPELLSPAP